MRPTQLFLALLTLAAFIPGTLACTTMGDGLPRAAGDDAAPPPLPPVEDRSEPRAIEGEALQLLEAAKAATPERYAFAIEQEARIVPTGDGRSFWVLWTPDGGAIGERPVVVSLHGHGSWAFDELAVWHEALAERGYGLAALQWWFGEGEGPADYYQPRQAYEQMEALLRDEGVGAGQALFHGFSRGAANSYAITVLDAERDNHFFVATLANAGGASMDFPPNVDIASGARGSQPFEGTRWVMYCGLRDPNPARDGCEAMRRTSEWVTGLGGTVDLLIEDSQGDHGGFHRDEANVAAALDVFDSLRERGGTGR